MQFGIAELILGQGQRCLGGVEFGFTRAQVLQGGIIVRTRCDARRKQLPQSIFGTLRFGQNGGGGGNVSFGRAQLVLIILLVKAREKFAFLDRDADFDRARNHLA